jgi:hypothetical protein
MLSRTTALNVRSFLRECHQVIALLRTDASSWDYWGVGGSISKIPDDLLQVLQDLQSTLEIQEHLEEIIWDFADERCSVTGVDSTNIHERLVSKLQFSPKKLEKRTSNCTCLN